MATRKITHYVIAVVIFIFLVSIFSGIILEAEQSEGVDTGMLSDSLSDLAEHHENSSRMTQGFTNYTDKTSIFTSGEDNNEIDERGSDAAWYSIFSSKSLIIRFILELNKSIPTAYIVIGFIITIVGLVGGFLLLRSFTGEGKL